MFRDHRIHKGILLFRLKDEGASTQARILAAALDQYADQYADQLRGQFAVIKEESIRIHGNLILLLTDDANSE